MQGGYFVDNHVGIERNAGGTQLPPKRFGKYFRDMDDALMQHKTPNDPTLPWHKEIILAWHIDAKKDQKGRLMPMKFEGHEAYKAALDSGDYFSSPNAAIAAKKSKLEAKIADIDSEIDTAKEVNDNQKKAGRPKKA